MSLPPRFLDEIRARIACSAVVGRRVRLVKRGREHSGLCPFHNEKTPSFTVNDDKGFFHCLAGETGVITREGVRPIASLAGRRAVVLTRGGAWVSAPFKSYGRQQLYRIELSRNGVRKTVFATSGHRWFVRGRKSSVVTTDLRVGHRLESVLPQPQKRISLDDQGVRHGIVFGDGTVQRKGKSGYGTVNLHGAKAADLAKWFSAYRPTSRKREDGVDYLRVYGGRDFAGMKALPSPTEPDEYLRGFIAGYLATDGHVAKDGTVMLHCIDPDVLGWVRDVATRLGIGTFSVTTQERTGYLSEKRPIHRIHFVASTLPQAMLLRVEARRRSAGATKRFERLRWAVTSVAASERVEEVYCAEVPEHHAFALEDNILTGNCFGCGAHGDVIGFVMRVENLSFPEAVERLAEEAGLEMPRMTPEQVQREREAKSLGEAVEAAAQWFEAQLRAPAGRAALDYLQRQRGLDDATIARFRLGYAPEDRQALRRALKAQGFDDAMLVEASLLFTPEGGGEPYAFFRDRVMFPVCDRRGRVIAFGGRVMGDAKPKYINSRDTPLFDKGRSLYALDKAAEGVRAGAELIVAEGYMDVIALHAAGFTGAVAPLGTALTEAQIELLWRLAPEPIVCLDGDEAGQRAAMRAAERVMPLLKPGHSLRFASLPAGDDPDDLIKRDGRAAFAAVIARPKPLVDVLWENAIATRAAATPEQRAALEQNFETTAAKIANETVQWQYRRTFRERLRQHFWPRRQWAPRDQRAGGFAGRAGQPAPLPQGMRAAHVPPTVDTLSARVIARTLVNHLDLLNVQDVFDQLDAVHFEDAALDRLRHDLLAIVAHDGAIHRDRLIERLTADGHGPTLAVLERPEYHLHAPFAREGAAFDDALAGLMAFLRGLHLRNLRRDLERARERHAADLSPQSLMLVEALARMIAEEEAEAEQRDLYETGPAVQR